MIKSQVITLNVIYDEGEDEIDPVFKSKKSPPADWDWSDLIDEPIRNAVEVLAAGPVKEYPGMSES